MGRRLGIIGTAGRKNVMSRDYWKQITNAVDRHIKSDDHLVSGGAAWADHAAIWAFLTGRCAGLTLHLPAQFGDGRFRYSRDGETANYYHRLFSCIVGFDSLCDIESALERSTCIHTISSGFKERNRKIADDADCLLAFTFGETQPPPGGSLHTWQRMKNKQKFHFQIDSESIITDTHIFNNQLIEY